MYETTYEGDISYSDKQFLRTELDKNLLLFYSLLTNLFTFYGKKKKKKNLTRKRVGSSEIISRKCSIIIINSNLFLFCFHQTPKLSSIHLPLLAKNVRKPKQEMKNTSIPDKIRISPPSKIKIPV